MGALAHRGGLLVRAWGIKQRSEIDRLFETGTDGATTNWPDWIVEQPHHCQGRTI